MLWYSSFCSGMTCLEKKEGASVLTHPHSYMCLIDVNL